MHIGHFASDLSSVQEQDCEGKDGTDDKHSYVRRVSNWPDVVRLAFLSQAWQTREPHHAEQKENRTEDDEHVISDPVDDSLEICRVFFIAHECTGEDEAYKC